jgi:3-methylfumaryl-CoA hydratase
MSNEITRDEVIAPGPVAMLAGLLDIDTPDDGYVPELWHWLYLLERPPTRLLGPDGHPTSGIPAPPGPGMRRMFASGRVDTLARLRIGEPARRSTRVVDQADKRGRSGPLRFVTVRHVISQRETAVIVEDQVVVYRGPSRELEPTSGQGLATRQPMLTLDVDEALLFRFSALTYNAHRIHYDREWCRKEGYRDLVVHGPLQALMMGELARRNGVPLLGRRFDYRLVSPMLGPQSMYALAGPDGLRHGAEIRAADGRQTAACTLTDLPAAAAGAGEARRALARPRPR